MAMLCCARSTVINHVLPARRLKGASCPVAAVRAHKPARAHKTSHRSNLVPCNVFGRFTTGPSGDQPSPGIMLTAAEVLRQAEVGTLPAEFMPAFLMDHGMGRIRPVPEEQQLLRRALLACLPRMAPDQLALGFVGWTLCIGQAGWDADAILDGQLAAGFEQQLLRQLPSMNADLARSCMLGWSQTGAPVSPALEAAMRTALLCMLQPAAVEASPSGAVRALIAWFELRRPLDAELQTAAEAALLLALESVEKQDLIVLSAAYHGPKRWPLGREAKLALRRAGGNFNLFLI